MPEAYDGEVLTAPPSGGAQPYTGEVLAAPPAPSPPQSVAYGDIDKNAGIAEGAASILSGSVATPLAGLSGMAAAFAKALGISDTEAHVVVQKVQDALTYQPRSETGKNVAGLVAAPFEALAHVGTAAGEKVADVTGSPALGTAVSTGIQAAPLALGKVAPKVSGAVGDAVRNTAETQMQSALKPTLEQLRTGKAGRAIDTMLDEGVNVTRGGVEKLQDRIDGLNERIKDLIDNSPATIDKQRVGYYAQSVIDRFQKQVNPTSDLAAIQKAWDEFLTINPAQIPVKDAQAMKQGTYRALGEKSYGELKGADIEAQKALARGLKEEIASAVPEVQKLNADESRLLNALSVAERRVLMDANKNPAGLGWLTTSPSKFGLWMADRSPLFKSLVARMINASAEPLEGAISTTSATAVVGGPGTAAERERRRKRRDELLRTLQ